MSNMRKELKDCLRLPLCCGPDSGVINTEDAII